MTKYQQFLDVCGVISEKDFNEILKDFPEDIDLNEVTCDDLNDITYSDDVKRTLLEAVISTYSNAWVPEIDYKNLTFSLECIEDFDQLESIKNSLQKWTITNYYDIVGELTNSIGEKEFSDLLEEISQKASKEQLQEFLKQL